MYPIVVLSLIALALLAFGRTREGLAPTNLIKAPPYNDAEKDRIWAMVPEAAKTAFRTDLAADGVPAGPALEAEMKQTVYDGVASFYTNVYATATTPITHATIDNSPGPNNAHSRLGRAATKAYFVDQTAVSTPGTGGATGATGTSTAGTPANPQGASSTTGTPAPAPGLYIQLKTQFDTKKAAYDALVISASRSTAPTDEDINQLRNMNRELFTILEQTIQALSTFQTDDIASVNRELTATLTDLERQYSILSENSDKVETLRRIREFEETKKGGNVGIYMIALLVMALAVLVIMVFFQRTNAPATPATTSPPSMANLT
jgi:hypothetical protein